MFGEAEDPPTIKEKEYIKLAVDHLRRNLPDDLARAVLEGPCDRILKGIKRDLIEIEVKPEDDWLLKGNSLKHRTKNVEVSLARWQEICERAWFKHRWHFEFHESDEGTKYVILLKCFGEVLGKKQSDIAAMDIGADDVEDTPKRKEKRKKSSMSSKDHAQVVDEAPLPKRKSRRASKLLEDGKLLENVKDKRSSRKSVRETVIPASSDTMRARQLRRKESNLSNSSSSRT
eukprot:TRINITY_DN380_c0_g1_i1.p1 TRINITY_DN380_c0_g1~~TRINITY_DN380_c0_g1_i1.p1  ORF type:complete len:231 (+),score=39.28 TRINITY_DN380_c0_g1_i1:289-981(+)